MQVNTKGNKLTKIRHTKTSKRAQKITIRNGFDPLSFNFEKDWKHLNEVTKGTDEVLRYSMHITPTRKSHTKCSARHYKSNKQKERSSIRKTAEINADLNLELE